MTTNDNDYENPCKWCGGPTIRGLNTDFCSKGCEDNEGDRRCDADRDDRRLGEGRYARDERYLAHVAGDR